MHNYSNTLRRRRIMPSAPRHYRPRHYKPSTGRSLAGHKRHKLYQCRAWRRTSQGFLAKHPWCVECEKEGELRPAVVTDHIVPWKGDTTLFWDRSNWQSMCLHHHGIKSAGE